jgi:hypothetical protein
MKSTVESSASGREPGAVACHSGRGRDELGSPVTTATAVAPGGTNAPSDLQQAYQRRKAQLRPGDINALTALKREFR